MKMKKNNLIFLVHAFFNDSKRNVKKKVGDDLRDAADYVDSEVVSN